MIEHPNPKSLHVLPLGAIVEVDVDVYDTTELGSEVYLKGRCKLFVVAHHWDCDGTPLYALSSIPVIRPEGGPFSRDMVNYMAFATYATKGGGYSGASLKDTGKRITLFPTIREWWGL